MKRQGLSFREALETLARSAGIDLEPVRQGPQKPREELLALTSSAAVFYQQMLRSDPDARKAREFLAQKKLAPATWDLFGLGFAPRDGYKLVHHLEARGFTRDQMYAAGVTGEGPSGPRDRFQGRLIIPIRDRDGHVRGFAGRSLDGTEPKFLNSPQTDLFDKGGLLFGLDLAQEAIRKSGAAVIVEGYTDVMAAHQAGLRNVVATMGTALTPRQARLLARLASKIVLALDADPAGATAVIRDVEALRQSLGKGRASVSWGGILIQSQQIDIEIKVAQLPPGKDPDDVITEDPTHWEKLIGQAQDLVEYYLNYYAAQADIASARGKAKLVRELAPVLRAVKDPVEREHYIQQVATLIGLSPTAVRQSLQLAPQPLRIPETESAERTAQLVPEDHLLAFLLRYPQVLYLEHDLSADDFPRPDDKLIFGTLLQAVYNEPNLNTQRVLDLMEDTLKERAERLANSMSRHPDLDDIALDRAFKLQVLRHRDLRLRSQLQQYRLALSAAEEEADAQAVSQIAAEIRRIALKLAELGAAPRQKI
jgi:DNA primase